MKINSIKIASFLLLTSFCFASKSPDLKMVGIPTQGKQFVMYMEPEDTIGSAMKCMEKLHNGHYGFFLWRKPYAGGVCQIEPGSLNVSKHARLDRLYPDAYLTVRK